MRGKLTAIQIIFALIGITPAYAGKTADIHRQRLVPWDHPRVCGENAVAAFGEWCVGGSPPRMRGKPSINDVKMTGIRITPAYAGKT